MFLYLEYNSKLRFIIFADNEYFVKKEPGFIDDIRDFLRPGILKPLQLVCLYSFFALSVTLAAMRPYTIDVLIRLEIPLLPNILLVSLVKEHKEILLLYHIIY